jgi:FKBP-type peptidyl-prolyl cis-trans isomerase
MLPLHPREHVESTERHMAAADADAAAGLQGTGKSPAPGTMIRCHYTGWLASNGRVFDSSYERGRPLMFKVGAAQGACACLHGMGG